MSVAGTGRRRPRLPKLRFRFIVAEEYQPVSAIPWRTSLAIWLVASVFMYMQVTRNLDLPPPQAAAIDLGEPPSEYVVSAMTLGDRITLAKSLTLWLQAFDNQQGQSVSFHDLDYGRVVDWLRVIAGLDPLSQYPHLNAARVYTAITDKEKVRKMLLFVAEEFREAPHLRWEWMATACTQLKNVVEDTNAALECARELRELTEGVEGVPGWARQMKGFLLLDLDEFDSAADFLLQLIESGEVTDPNEFELHFSRLNDLVESMIREGKVTSADRLSQMFEKMDKIQTEFVTRAS